MKYFVMSDLHVDFYCIQTRFYDTILPEFEKFFDEKMLPAEGLILAGDIANDYITQLHFLQFLCTKYKEVYYCFGNHDIVVRGATFGNGNSDAAGHKLTSSEARMLQLFKDTGSIKNLHILEGSVINNFTGCIGMCDFSYVGNTSICAPMLWKKDCFDGRHWNFFDNVQDDIVKHYDKMLDNLVSQHPKVVMTHFCPIEIGIDPAFANEYKTAYFYFDAVKYLDQMDDDSYWICGHTHTAWKTDYVNKNGNTIHLICHPLGYPNERPYKLNNLSKDDFLIEIDNEVKNG